MYLHLKVFIAKESLVWFDDSGFCYTIDARPSLRLLLDMLLLLCCGDPAVLGLQDPPPSHAPADNK